MPISQVPFAGISNPVDFRNIVINGDMQVAQRSTSVASITTTGYYTIDRFQTGISSLGTWTMSQSTDVPTGQGFANSLKLDCTTADASPAAGDFMAIQQFFEGQNLQYLKKGTANALPLTASFWVKSTKTGTFICELRDGDNSRSISKSYTVNVTNTWEFKTITFPGDTTGALDNDNARSLELNFWLGAGSTYTSGTLQTSWGATVTANIAVGQVNIADSTSNDFLITGVQLEAGEQASGFEFMPIDVDLGRCYRYCQVFGRTSGACMMVGQVYTTSQAYSGYQFLVTMRAAPTLSYSALSDWYINTAVAGGLTPTAFSIVNVTTQNAEPLFTVASGLVAGNATALQAANANATFTLSAEL